MGEVGHVVELQRKSCPIVGLKGEEKGIFFLFFIKGTIWPLMHSKKRELCLLRESVEKALKKGEKRSGVESDIRRPVDVVPSARLVFGRKRKGG